MGMNALRVAISAAAVAVVMGVVPANAQATRTWVSGVGDDANPCSRTAPCKTFAGAISKTAGGGEINVLDPGGFGGVTITKSLTIKSVGVEAGVLVSGTNAIIEGLDIEGLGTGLNGVTFLQGSLLIINNCTINKFTQSGVNAASSTAGARTVINKSVITSNGTNAVANTGGVTVSGSNIVNINDTLIQNNLNYGVQATGGSAIAAFTRSIVTPTGIVSVSSGGLVSIGPSNFFAAGAPTQAVINFQ